MKKSSEGEVEIGFSVKDLATALQELSDENREFFIENLLAATSPEQLASIDEALRDFREGRAVQGMGSAQMGYTAKGTNV